MGLQNKFENKIWWVFFELTFVLEAEENINQQAVKDSYHYLSETEKTVAAEMCSISLRCLILYSILSLETPEDAKYFCLNADNMPLKILYGN